MLIDTTEWRMERGEDWERRAVRERWTALERQRCVTRRLVGAFSLGLVAAIVFLAAMVPEACISGRGTQNACISTTGDPTFTALVLVGSAALGGGVWLCRSARSIELRHRRNGTS